MVDYKLVENYKDDKQLREKFNNFTEIIFSGLNFEKWYEFRYWTQNYIPYSLIKNDIIISNVSISKMDLLINGKLIRGIQFGTVGTLPEYRKQGLSKYLMEYILDKYERTTDLFFLYANETVLDFYPNFGFHRVMESIYKLDSTIPKPEYFARKLNINNNDDLNLIKKVLDNRLPITTIFGATNHSFITMWHLIYVFSEDIYYIEKENILFVQTFKQNQLHIWDIIFSKPFDFECLLPKIIPDKDLGSIYFYFPPDVINFNYDKVVEDKNSMFFVKGNFPLKGKQFKFPTTAQT